MARPAGHPKQKKNLYMRRDICQLCDLLLTPVGGKKPPHGAWSDLVEKLLRQHWKTLTPEKRAFLEQKLKEQKASEVKAVMDLI